MTTKNLHLIWLIAHEPAYLFYRVAEDFKNLVNKQNKVKIEIEILNAEDYNKKYNPTIHANRHNLAEFLQSNQIQIAQMQTTSLAKQFNENMYVLDLPYIFENHNHAQEVLEGEVGDFLLNSFNESSKLKGLAFTYSGGFRLMPFNKKVSSLNEIIGSTVRSGMSKIAQETIKSLGFIPFPTEIDEVSTAVKSGNAIGGEHVAQRLLPDQCEEWIQTLINTEHSLFLTSIVVNIDWWNKLDDEVKVIFTKAAIEAARNERQLSLHDGEQSITMLKSRGATFIELSDNEKQDLINKTKIVYTKVDKNLNNLVSKIKKKDK